MGETPSALSEAAPDPYSNYHAWKHWDELFSVTQDQAGYFTGELRDLKISGARVLEIGFGSGACLAWMKQRGAGLYGCEISEASRAAAQSHGVTVIPPDLPAAERGFEGRFDSIIAFDVFEHLPMAEVKAYLGACEKMLCKGGKLLLRFPNSQSPFGLQPQMGDPTHRSALSRSVIELLIVDRAFSIVRYGPSYLYLGASLPKRLVRTLRLVAQRAITGILNLVYATGIPYEPVVVIVLVRD